MLINCRTTMMSLTSQDIRDKLENSGWNLTQRWNMEWAAAMRVYSKTHKPVKVIYEGLNWFIYDENSNRCPHCGK